MRPYVRDSLPEWASGIPGNTCMEAGFLMTDNSGWREIQPSIDTDACTGCGMCYLYCPDGAIKMDDGKATVDFGFCKGCGICARMCRPKALTMEARQ